MLARIIFIGGFYLLVIAWSICAATVISLWIKLLKLRGIMKRKDDE